MEDLPRTREKIEKGELIRIANALRKDGLDAKVFPREDGQLYYLAVRMKSGEAPHVFKEVESKEAAKNSGATAASDSEMNSIVFWKQIWEKGE